MPDARLTRRVAGVLATRLPELELAEVSDPRRAQGRRWALTTLLRALITGLVAGCHSLAEVEDLTADLSRAMRRLLRLPRRVPDTTLRDAACRLDPTSLRHRLHHQAHVALRRRALEPDGLPFGVVAMDGKATAATSWDDEYAQRQPHSAARGAHGIVRTITCMLVSSRVKCCLDAIPIPAATNEMGHFQAALASLWAAYRGVAQLKLISYDSGACAPHNAAAIRGHGLHYLLRLDAQNPTVFAEAQRVLGRRPVSAAQALTEDHTGSGSERRYLFVTEELSGYYDWDHLRVVLRVHSVKRDREGRLVSQPAHQQDRYYLCSLPRRRLTDDQWLLLVRRHWGVENEGHNVLDKFLQEDRHPVIQADPQGMLALMLLRRLAYNLLALFRGVTQRGEEQRQTPWRTVMRWFYNTLITATADHVAGLRRRRVTALGV